MSSDESWESSGSDYHGLPSENDDSDFSPLLTSDRPRLFTCTWCALPCLRESEWLCGDEECEKAEKEFFMRASPVPPKRAVHPFG